jgi:hypothetical protein
VTHSSDLDVNPAANPEAAPAPVGDGMPFLPAAVLPTPSVVAEPATFDAKAMVESQRSAVANPAYGALPTGTDASREASNHLRAQAQKKRRRNKRVGQLAVVLLLGAMATGGFFVYRAYQKGQAEADAEVSGDVSTDADAVTPLGEQGAALEALDDLNSVTPASAGGLLGAVDEARELTQVQPPPPPTVVGGLETPQPARVAHRPDFRSTSYFVRVYDGFDPAAPFRNFEVTYDTVTDDYHGFVENTATGQSEFVSFDGEWRYAVGPDGVSRRVHRSEFSRSVEPDTPLAGLLGELDVLPTAARSHATMFSQEPTSEVGIDGTPLTTFGYFLDVAAFRNADPVAYASWRNLWATAPHDIVDLIEPGTEQMLPGSATPYVNSDELQVIDLTKFEIVPFENQTAVIFTVTEQGIVNLAALISPEENLRIVYVALGYSDESSSAPFPPSGWVDAP